MSFQLFPLLETWLWKKSREGIFTSRSKEMRHGILLDLPLDDPERCRDCDGACCRAFPHVQLDWAEYRRLAGLGARRLEWSPHGGYQLNIEFACEFLAGGRCLIYADRPDICRRFYCADIRSSN